MSYLGQAALKNSELKVFNVTSSTSATHTLSWTAPNEQSLFITINGVKQQDGAYSIAGSPTVITLSSALVATDEMEVIGVVDIGVLTIAADNTVSTSALGNTSVTTAKIAANAVTTDKILDDAVTADKLANSINTEIAANTAKVTNATHTGDVTGATALTIAVDAVDIPMLSATGTASATTFLRGDNSWAAAGGDNTPAFQAYLSANQTIAYDTSTKVTFDTEDYDTDSAYDKDTNHRFTVPAGEGGKYYVYFKSVGGAASASQHNKSYSYIYVNGNSVSWVSDDSQQDGKGETVSYYNAVILTLAAADYVECFFYLDTANGAAGRLMEHKRGTMFGAYKMIGL